MPDIYVFKGVDFEIGFKEFNKNNNFGFIDFLKVRNMKILSKDFSYRVINHWEKNNLIDSKRIENKGWRKYSIIDIVWLYIIKELREFGVTHELLKKVRNSLEANSNKNFEFLHLAYYVSLAFVNIPVYILVFKNGETYGMTEREYQMNKEYGSNNNHIKLNIGKILQKIFPSMNLASDFSRPVYPAIDEKKAVQLLRSGKYDEVEITIENEQGIDEIITKQNNNNSEQIIRLLKNNNFRFITIKLRNKELHAYKGQNV